MGWRQPWSCPSGGYKCGVAFWGKYTDQIVDYLAAVPDADVAADVVVGYLDLVGRIFRTALLDRLPQLPNPPYDLRRRIMKDERRKYRTDLRSANAASIRRLVSLYECRYVMLLLYRPRVRPTSPSGPCDAQGRPIDDRRALWRRRPRAPTRLRQSREERQFPRRPNRGSYS